ncbi:hypothetical protein DOY81_005564 [Sarcophaga bullata]|nr:hypothetical protein DOY81_005564 [Sarcophaga bullata]
METKTNEEPSTSKIAQSAKLNTPTSPTLSKAATSHLALKIPSTTNTNTPPLGQIGKQGSINFRQSLLYDSDADDQTFLLRPPSIRSHKFIIIPASSNMTQDKRIPTALSTTSLTSLQKLPLRSPTNQNLNELIVPPTPNSPPAIVSSRITTNKFRTTQKLPSTTAETTAATLSPLSDVIHQSKVSESRRAKPTVTATPTASSNSNTSVKFTIEDYESDNATDATTHTTTPTLDALYSFNMPAITSIYSVNSNNKSNFTLPSQLSSTSSSMTTSQQPLLSSSTLSSPAPPPPPIALAKSPTTPSVRPVSALFASNSCSNTFNIGTVSANVTPSLGIGLRPRNDRNSSMRSVVSAYLSDPNDLTINSLIPPDGDSSSYLFRDSVANQIYSDVTSVRSLASIGIGSTDGRKLVIKRVPQTPTELLNIVNPPTPQLPGVDDDDDDSLMDISDETSNLKPRNQHWGNKMQFVLACIGYSVGLGNVWRFPYMCYKSGGGVFLVPYCIILIICSIPLLFMELSIGQYTGRGPIGALGQLCPLFKGAGLASVVVSFLMSTYYSVIIGYSIYYFFTAFKTEQPWIDCNNRWNTPDCWVPHRSTDNVTAPPSSRTPSEEFFQNKVLQISPGIEYPGSMRWELFACLICAWLMVYFATWKSIKSSAKVRYFTATFPFILIIILMGRAVTLEGADDGLRYFFRPNWSELKNANVWINAASQNFNSLGITFGSMISFASYNKYNNNILRDTIAVSVVNILTSLLVGVFAFATIGNLALEQNTDVKNVISDGPGLIFVVYPQVMAKMPYAQLWAVMFFFMLLCLGLNSQFAIVEVVVTSIQDGFPNWIKRHLGYHEIVVLIAIWILSLINYKEPTYHNGNYTYPDWAYGIGWMFASFSLICIPYYALINLWKAQGSSLTERFQIALRPNIYECKICGEHHCEHDYPEQEQYMLSQELAGVYKATAPIQSPPQNAFPMSMGQKSGYNPMHLQQQEPSQPRHENVYDKPSTSVNNTTDKQQPTTPTR